MIDHIHKIIGILFGFPSFVLKKEEVYHSSFIEVEKVRSFSFYIDVLWKVAHIELAAFHATFNH